MPIYRYHAVQPPRRHRRGTVAADSPRSARKALRARGLVIRNLEPVPAERRSWIQRRHRSKLLSFLMEVSTLLGVGTPLLDALDQLAQQHRGTFRILLVDLKERVASGQSFSEALRAHPATFDSLCIAIAQAGEDSGSLDTALNRLAGFKERSHQLASQVTTTLIYPGIVLVMAIGIAVFLMTAVVPSILEPLVEMGRPLPLPTRLVQLISELLTKWGWLATILVLLLMPFCVWAYRVPRVRAFFDRAVLKTPILGELVRKTTVLRIAIVMSTLLNSGVVFLHALAIAASTTRNSVMKDALDRCGTAVTAGSDISSALAATEAFPPVVVQVFALGQQSGQLPELLDKLAARYDRDVATASARLTAILEPLLIVSLAAIVLVIAMATMLPIMEVGNAVQ